MTSGNVILQTGNNSSNDTITLQPNVIDLKGHTEIDTLNVSGVSTFTGNVSFASSALFGDNDKILLGDGNDLEIFHGTGSWVRSVNPASNFFHN